MLSYICIGTQRATEIVDIIGSRTQTHLCFSALINVGPSSSK